MERKILSMVSTWKLKTKNLLSLLGHQEVQDRNKRQRKKILYAGALWADWFDWGLLEYTIRNCPDYDFVVIGGDIAAPEENVQGNNGDVR